MLKIRWELEESVALMNLYFSNGCNMHVSKEKVENLSVAYKKRALEKGLLIDEKFRNISGLNMQLACIHYIVTEGKEGLSQASKLFYSTYNLYLNDREKFDMIYNNFKSKYM